MSDDLEGKSEEDYVEFNIKMPLNAYEKLEDYLEFLRENGFEDADKGNAIFGLMNMGYRIFEVSKLPHAKEKAIYGNNCVRYKILYDLILPHKEKF